MRWIIVPIGLALYTLFSQGGLNGLLQGNQNANQNARMRAVAGFSQDELRSRMLQTLEAIEDADREYGRRGPGHFPRPNSFNRN
jgi:hypothetical protein